MQDIAPRRAAPATLPTRLPGQAWPYPAHMFDVDGTRVAYYDVGSGPVLLFVHTGLWSFVWRDVFGLVSPHFRCIALDAPGTGLSAPPDGAVTLECSARAVSALIAHERLQRLTLVVHDLGGLAGIVGAVRSTAVVEGLVAINAFAWRPTGVPLRAMLRAVGSAPLRELDAWLGLVPRITATDFGVGRHLDAMSRAAFRAAIGKRQVRAFHHYLADALECAPLHIEAESALATELAHVPALTIFGERNDPFHFQAEWRRRLPDVAQLVLPNGNHFPMCDDPTFVANAITRWHGNARISRAS